MDDITPRKKLYSSTRWQEARAKYLTRNPVCVHCGKRAVVVDHIAGHGDGWRERFWNPAGWQALCKPCHSRKTVVVDDMQNARGLNGWRVAMTRTRGGAVAEVEGKPRSRLHASHAPPTTSKPTSTAADPRTSAAIALLSKLKGK
jgi:hypothetical protein